MRRIERDKYDIHLVLLQATDATKTSGVLLSAMIKRNNWDEKVSKHLLFELPYDETSEINV